MIATKQPNLKNVDGLICMWVMILLLIMLMQYILKF